MKKITILIIGCLLVTSLAANRATAQKSFRLSLDVGLAKLLGEDSNMWKPGYALGVNGLYAVSEKALIGGRIGYNRLPVDKMETPFGSFQVDGWLSVVELAFIVRFTGKPFGTKKNYFFGQIGTGYSFLKTKATAGPGSHFWSKVTGFRFPLNLGGGYALGRFILSPQLNIVFTEGSTTTYFSLLAGIEF